MNIFENVLHKHHLLLVDYIKLLPKKSLNNYHINSLWQKLISHNIPSFLNSRLRFVHTSYKLSLRKMKYLIEEGSEFIVKDPVFLDLLDDKNLPVYMNVKIFKKNVKKSTFKKEDLLFEDVSFLIRKVVKNNLA